MAFMVGPVFLLLLEIAMTKGVKRALAFDLGVIAADILFIVAVFYSSSFLSNVTHLAWVYGIGGVLIIGYGIYNIRSAKSKKHHLKEKDELPEGQAASLSVYAIKGFFMNFLNVGVLAYWLATVVVMRASVNNDENTMKVYFIVTVATYFAVDLAKIFSARKLKKRLTDMVLIRIEKTVGLVLVVFGALMIVRGVFQSMGMSLEEQFTQWLS